MATFMSSKCPKAVNNFLQPVFHQYTDVAVKILCGIQSSEIERNKQRFFIQELGIGTRSYYRIKRKLIELGMIKTVVKRKPIIGHKYHKHKDYQVLTLSEDFIGRLKRVERAWLLFVTQPRHIISEEEVLKEMEEKSSE